ncbi:transposase [Saccharopolyspora phatthalungensis]|uniref:Transposase n=1 Tax=Saccharopolyspora phatthalungensis TaxID=664693 RepID=A0A840QHQ3_9PSEU|nr:transposase [Saccharopolyspora phatthalungensis]
MSPISGHPAYSAQSHLTFVLQKAEQAIRSVRNKLDHSPCAVTELHELAAGLDEVVRGIRGYLDLMKSTGGTQ